MFHLSGWKFDAIACRALAVEAIETPGQIWCPEQVDPLDVEPHPLSELVPSCGLKGCYCDDEQTILATAWQPYQDLFQGTVCCLHADFSDCRVAAKRKQENPGPYLYNRP